MIEPHSDTARIEIDPRTAASARTANKRARVPDLRRTALEARRRRVAVGLAEETGAVTAEYAIATLAACGFTAVLVALLKGDQVKQLLLGIITAALGLGS